ncbi:LOW QUALITY PROTEIN: calcium-activated potassium channel subunit beta-4-like [Petromyzon marinus]|uniref:LOW QUALITY PROTEIN: calcium-activated potassium channel subunit beta-4-like n=1 Tax=Petromyzon marinus TaxID=7757 RepID=UPI003F7277FD
MGRHARGAPTFASEGEDRAIRLGVVLVLFAFASFSTLALCWMRPALQRRARSREDNCSVARVDAGDGGAAGPAGEPCFFSCGPACRGDSRYPCVRVFARLAHSPGRVALLHQDLLQLSLNPRVRAGGQVLLRAGLVPPGPLRERAQRERLGSAVAAQSGALRLFPCYFDGQLRPDDVILDRDDTRAVVFHCVFWPFLTLLVGLLLIGLATCAKSLAVRAEAMRKLKKLR